MNILFVCSANVNRSKAFEREFKELLKNQKEVKIRSSGIYSYSGYGYKLDEKILKWADRVFVMTQAHKMFIEKVFNDYLSKVLKDVISYWFVKEFLTNHFRKV